MGVVGVVAPDAPALLGLVSLVAPVIVSGNSVVALASERSPYPAVLLGEMLARTYHESQNRPVYVVGEILEGGKAI